MVAEAVLVASVDVAGSWAGALVAWRDIRGASSPPEVGAVRATMEQEQGATAACELAQEGAAKAAAEVEAAVEAKVEVGPVAWVAAGRAVRVASRAVGNSSRGHSAGRADRRRSTLQSNRLESSASRTLLAC